MSRIVFKHVKLQQRRLLALYKVCIDDAENLDIALEPTFYSVLVSLIGSAPLVFLLSLHTDLKKPCFRSPPGELWFMKIL